MHFIVLGTFRKKPTKEILAQMDKLLSGEAKAGIKTIGAYWTLGSFDFVRIFEAPDEKALMKFALQFADYLKTETLVAVKREDAVKLVD